MLYKEITAVGSEIHIKHVNTLYKQDVEVVNVKLVVRRVTAGLQIVLNPLNNTINLNYV